jgi:hypothetical protein
LAETRPFSCNQDSKAFSLPENFPLSTAANGNFQNKKAFSDIGFGRTAGIRQAQKGTAPLFF